MELSPDMEKATGARLGNRAGRRSISERSVGWT